MSDVLSMFGSGLAGFIFGDLAWLILYAVLSGIITIFGSGGVFIVDPLAIMLSPFGLMCGVICGALCMVGVGGKC